MLLISEAQVIGNVMRTVCFQLCFCTVIALTGCTGFHTQNTLFPETYSQRSHKAEGQFTRDARVGELSRTRRVRTVDDLRVVPGKRLDQLEPLRERRDHRSLIRLAAFESTEPSLPAPLIVQEDNLGEDRGYTLAEIEQIALGNNPAILSARTTIGISSGLYQQVGARPNPVVGYSAQQLADRSTDQHGLFVEQEFVRGDKLALNREVLSYTNQAQQLEFETQRHRVLTDVRVRFYEALSAQLQRDITRQFVEVAERGVKIAKELEDAGEGTLIETLQSETLLSEVTLAAEKADAAFQGAWRDLVSIAGLPETSPTQLLDELIVPSVTPDWEVTYSKIISQSPELATARAIVCEKQALYRRQEVQAIPNITGQLGAGYDHGTNHGMINLQVSMPLPVHNNNEGNITAAYYEYVRATQEVKRLEQAIRSRLARATQEFESAMASVRKYETEIIPQVRKSLDLSEKAYGGGELGFLQVLVVRRSYYDSSVRLIQARGRLAQAAAKINGLLLTGGLNAPQKYTDDDGLREASIGGQ